MHGQYFLSGVGLSNTLELNTIQRKCSMPVWTCSSYRLYTGPAPVCVAVLLYPAGPVAASFSLP